MKTHSIHNKYLKNEYSQKLNIYIKKISGKFMSLVFLLCYIKKMVATIKNHNIY